ncbi:MAG: transposase [Owenweeksia sp.]|nr:transposase [Owenweeksia sp.]
MERQYLKPLPSAPYELKDYRRAKVQKMGYATLRRQELLLAYPTATSAKSTQIHYTQSMVEVYYNHERIALDPRSRARGSYITNKEHLSSTHKAYAQWSPEYFKKLAGKHGKHVEALVSGILSNGDYREINYKRAMGLIQLQKTYGAERVDNACEEPCKPVSSAISG